MVYQKAYVLKEWHWFVYYKRTLLLFSSLPYIVCGRLIIEFSIHQHVPLGDWCLEYLFDIPVFVFFLLLLFVPHRISLRAEPLRILALEDEGPDFFFLLPRASEMNKIR